MPVYNRPRPRKRPKPKQWEAREQAYLVRELRRVKLMFNAQSNGVPLSGKASRDAWTAGVQKGAPDLLIFTPPPEHPEARGVALELKVVSKRPKTDRAHRFSGAEPHQKVYLEALEAIGWRCYVCYGGVHALEILKDEGYPVRVRDGERWRTPAAGAKEEVSDA